MTEFENIMPGMKGLLDKLTGMFDSVARRFPRQVQNS